MKRYLTVQLGSATLCAAALATPNARAAVYQICMKVNVQTIDSGAYDYSGRREDYWVNADQDSPNYYHAIARGIRSGVQEYGHAEVTTWADPATGCFSYSTSSSNPVVRVRAYSRARDENGNIVRVHDAGDDTSSSTPGSIWYQNIEAVTLDSQSATNVIVDGRSAGRTKWTVLAAAARTLYGYHAGLSNKTISIGFLPANGGCFDSSSAWSKAGHSSYEYIDEGYHLIRLSTCSQNQHLRKFLISHEMGHALARLYYGEDGKDSPKDTSFAGDSDACGDGNGYGFASMEYDSVGFPEGFAHFISARTWNAKAGHATFNWFGNAFAVEHYDFETHTGGEYLKGGHIRNVCDTAEHGVSTNGDWLRFYWDWYTTPQCSTQPSKTDMLRLYRQVRKNRANGVYAPLADTFHWAVHLALDDIPQLSSCERSEANAALDWNAAGGLYHGW